METATKIKKQFRVKTTKKGFITRHQAQVNTVIGWRNFSCSNTGNISYYNNPNLNSRHEYDSIENYRRAKSLHPFEIEIINENK